MSPLIALALIAAPEPAAIVVFPTVIGLDAATILSRLQSEVEATIPWRPTLRLIRSEELTEPASSFLECGAAAECWAARLRPQKVELCVLPVINADADPPVVAMRIIRVADASIAATIADPITVTLIDSIRPRLGRALDDSGHPAIARLTIANADEATRVAIDPGPFVRTGPTSFDLAPGRQRLRASSGERILDLELAAIAEQEIRVDLPAPPTEEPSIVASPWLWIGIGLGVVAGAIGIAIAAQPRDVCVRIGEGDC
jgi:hypothetical protein